jgi:hypothetical protein
MGIIFLLIFIAFFISAIVTNHNFTKRKLAFAALATAFSLSVIPGSVIGIIAKSPSDEHGPGEGFIMLFVMFWAFIVWIVLIALITNFRPLKALCYGIAIVMTICFALNCRFTGFNIMILLLLLANSAYFILCAFLIEKAKSRPMKIIAITLTVISFILPFFVLRID